MAKFITFHGKCQKLFDDKIRSITVNVDRIEMLAPYSDEPEEGGVLVIVGGEVYDVEKTEMDRLITLLTEA